MGNKVQVGKDTRILIFSADNRNTDYISKHNRNLIKYADIHGYKYIFHNKNIDDIPVYWSKMEYCRRHLESDEYDYVVWMDTDAYIIDMKKPITDMINLCHENKDHIIIGTDHDNPTLCAGVFVVKNSAVGHKFVNQCLHELKTKCIKDGKYDLGGTWAGLCYEQGRMNKLLRLDYTLNYTIVGPKYIYNTLVCNNDNVFIIHLYSSGKNIIMSCLDKYLPGI